MRSSSCATSSPSTGATSACTARTCRRSGTGCGKALALERAESTASGRHGAGIAASNAERLERLGREELLWLQQARRQPLLMVIAKERLEHVAVRLETVGPPVLAHFPQDVFDVCDLPGQHRRERGGVAEVLDHLPA